MADMALEYDNPLKFEKLAPVLEDYADWFAHIAAAVAYLDQAKPNDIAPPQSFKIWVQEISGQENAVNPMVMDDITKTHDEMLKLGQSILAGLSNKQKPGYEEFDEFKNLYGAFLLRLRRLEKDSATEGSSIDKETGLRNAKSVVSDLKKELERVARQGNPFSLVATRIDAFAGQTDQPHALSVATNNIKRCMRNFDDAYYLGNGHFLISLKHADIIGAEAAVSRLQDYLKNDDKNQSKLTMSYCIAEPEPEDNIETKIQVMQQDLSENLNSQDSVLKFKEVSDLQRFVADMNN